MKAFSCFRLLQQLMLVILFETLSAHRLLWTYTISETTMDVSCLLIITSFNFCIIKNLHKKTHISYSQVSCRICHVSHLTKTLFPGDCEALFPWPKATFDYFIDFCTWVLIDIWWMLWSYFGPGIEHRHSAWTREPNSSSLILSFHIGRTYHSSVVKPTGAGIQSERKGWWKRKEQEV